MLDRRTRQVGVQMIETALLKKAEVAVVAPTIGHLNPKAKQLAAPESETALAVMPKVLTVPV
jgi:hypothetical protein